MANITFGSKYFIFSKFSSIPKTSKIEQERANLIQEFNELNEFIKSEELKEFNSLESYLNSSEYKKLSTSTQSQKKTEQTEVKKYETQKKSKKIKSYFKFKESQKLKDYNLFSESKDLARFNELKETVSSSDFSSNKNRLENELKKADKKENKTEDLNKNKQELDNIYKIEKEFKQLSKSSQIKSFFKLQNSRKFKDFQTFEKSKELADYLNLEKYLASEEHKETLKSIEEKEKDEADKKKKFQDFKNSKKFKWYLSVKDSNKFDIIKKWEVVFEDDFTSGELDTEKWMTRYLWGDKLINDAYALETDKAFPTDGNNVEFSNNSLKIVTRKEQTEGKVWKQPFGFVPQQFDYTTGLISTAKSHRQKYGKVEAKIKVNYAKPVNYNFWMASEKNLPHVDILKLNKKKTKVELASHTGDLTNESRPNTIKSEFTGLDVAQDYFIYTFIWTPDKLIWKINEVIVNEQKKNIPQDEMYLVFSSSMTGKADGSGLPASLEIDWVRCYKEV
ncbi:MAG: hypothetical protein DRH89_07255 [Candidatus Cloacimonadota bacterium]|nr:MAG: hypothetical protein DRH89_07255 [Candidatus Cloacimonadota bacterium]